MNLYGAFTMKALLLIAHGSRREASNQEVRELAQRMAGHAGSGFDMVVPAFLELAQPGIGEGVAQCVRQGAREIQVVPYFLSAGRHVAQDIPEELARAAAKHPQARISLSPYLGTHPEIAALLLGLAGKRMPAPDAA
jgi:sirohydrochlorin ferrochelatase